MHETYAEAFCILGAASASNSSGGFFYERDPEGVRPWKLRPMDVDGHARTYCVIPTDFEKIERITEPLVTRGWVLQEQILARRMIYFGSGQIYWRCYGKAASKAFPICLPTQLRFEDRTMPEYFPPVHSLLSQRDRLICDASRRNMGLPGGELH